MFYPGRWTAAMMVVLRVGSIFAFSYFIHYHALRLSLQLGDAFFHFTEQAKSRQIFTCGFEDTLPLPCLCPPFPSRPDFIVSFFSCAFSCVVLQISVIIMDWKRARRERESWGRAPARWYLKSLSTRHLRSSSSIWSSDGTHRDWKNKFKV